MRACCIRCKGATFVSKEESVGDYLCFNVCPSNIWENTCYCV